MYVVIISSLLALLFTYLETKGQMKNGMKWGFFIITVIAAIHYNYGSDYPAYYALYEDIKATSFNLGWIMGSTVYKESGWVLLNYLFMPIGGFFTMVAVLNIVQNIIVYKFIRNNVEEMWWPLGVFIYLFSVSFYLYNFSMMRQGFVVCVFLGLWPYIRDRRWIIPTIVLILCSFIHNSAILLIPFAFLGFLPMRFPKVFGVLYITLFIALWLSGNFLNGIFDFMMESEEVQKYAETYGKGVLTNGFGIGFIMNLIPLIVTVVLYLTESDLSDDQCRLLCLGTLGFMVTPFARIFPTITRFGIYFGIYGVGAIPIAYSHIKNDMARIGVLSIFIVMTLYDYYYFFFQDITWISSYSEYHTIFEAL